MFKGFMNIIFYFLDRSIGWTGKQEPELKKSYKRWINTLLTMESILIRVYLGQFISNQI